MSSFHTVDAPSTVGKKNTPPRRNSPDSITVQARRRSAPDERGTSRPERRRPFSDARVTHFAVNFWSPNRPEAFVNARSRPSARTLPRAPKCAHQHRQTFTDRYVSSADTSARVSLSPAAVPRPRPRRSRAIDSTRPPKSALWIRTRADAPALASPPPQASTNSR